MADGLIGGNDPALSARANACGGAGGRPSPVALAPASRAFLAACLRCGSQLHIVDDLSAAADVVHSFRGGLGESFVVVASDEAGAGLVGGRLSPVIAHGVTEERSTATSDFKPQPRVAKLDEVSRIEKIIAFASGQAEADHPVCGDCLKHVIAEVQRSVEQASEEHNAYREAYERIQRDVSEAGGESLEALERQLRLECEELEAEEARLELELEASAREEEQLLLELERQREQELSLERAEGALWIDAAALQLELEEAESERAATASAIRYATTELGRLKRANVLNSMFHISDCGAFGTINGLRVGRLPGQIVPWEEINAAWGQACLLLDALVKKSGVSTQYRLLPRGSYSVIQAGGEVFDLFSVNGGLARFFYGLRFDLAMSAFLTCLKEVVNSLLQLNPEIKVLKLPFKIDGDKIEGFSVRQQFNQDERWTKALKFMLSNLKWAIAFVESKDFAEQRQRSRSG